MILLIGGCLHSSLPTDLGPATGTELHVLQNTAIDEASGLAVSRRHPGLLWLHNDSGGQAALYAVDRQGRDMRHVTIDGARNVDWEDLAIYPGDGGPQLLIADVGDNAAVRPTVQFYLLPEPAATQARATARRMVFAYEDGPRDVEAVAVDPTSRHAYLLSKRDQPPRLYRIALPGPGMAAPDTAVFLDTVDTIPPATAADRAADPRFGRFRSQPTAMSVSADGRRIVVTTYKDSHLYRRCVGEPWVDALARPPERIDVPQFRQTEAAGMNADGLRLFVASEQLPAQLAEVQLPP